MLFYFNLNIWINRLISFIFVDFFCVLIFSQVYIISNIFELYVTVMNGILERVASECLVVDSEDDQFNGRICV